MMTEVSFSDHLLCDKLAQYLYHPNSTFVRCLCQINGLIKTRQDLLFLLLTILTDTHGEEIQGYVC